MNSNAPARLDLRSHTVAGDRRAELMRLFPEIRTEGGKIDFDRLMLILGESIDADKERYGMSWPGKADCFKAAQAPSMGALIPCPEESVNFGATENLIIEGDNLDILKLLQKAYLGTIKLIYIDPPYNTGNEFIYTDNYTDSLKSYLKFTGQVDNEGKKFGANPETDGRFHSKWLNMMYPRLYLARNLLREDGLIFISIDDNEVSNLRKLCDDIFGEENFEGHIHWRRRHNQPNDKTKMLALVAEHILSYAKDEAAYRAAGVGKLAITGNFSNPDGDPRGDWASKPWKVGSDQSGSVYTIPTPAGATYTESWMGDRSTYERLLADDRILFPRNGKGAPRKKYFKSERELEGQCATNWWPHDQFGNNQGANAALEELFGEKNVFSNPKPVELVSGIMKVANVKAGDIVLDFFAGSGVTAHAALELAQQEGGDRRFILVQLPEPTGRADYPSIADICKERVRRVITKLNEADAGQRGLQGTQDRGFRVFKLAGSNFRTWNADIPTRDTTALQAELDLHVHHIREDRTDEDILYELLLKSGFPLTTRLEKLTLAEKTVYSAARGAFLLCLERELTLELIRAMVERKPERIICLDAGFRDNDQLKANAVQIFKTAGVKSFKTV